MRTCKILSLCLFLLLSLQTPFILLQSASSPVDDISRSILDVSVIAANLGLLARHRYAVTEKMAFRDSHPGPHVPRTNRQRSNEQFLTSFDPIFFSLSNPHFPPPSFPSLVKYPRHNPSSEFHWLLSDSLAFLLSATPSSPPRPFLSSQERGGELAPHSITSITSA